jgi:hypothetical protein
MLAGKLQKNLSKVLEDQIPASKKFTQAYGEMSQPINMFEDTALGRRITTGASDFLPDVPKMNPSDLPKAFFKDKHTVATLLKLSGNDEKFVNDAAGEYAASQLKDLGAKQARDWVRKNTIWLDSVPDVQKTVKNYVSRLESVSHTQDRARQLILGGAIGGGLTSGYWSLKHILGGQ